MTNGLFSGGDGTALTPYLVADALDLNAVRNNPASYYKQIADIDLSIDYTAGFVPIGTYAIPFTGTYDGDGFYILNLVMTENEANNGGLFYYVENGTLLNITLGNVDINFPELGSYAGGLCSEISGATITNCKVFGGNIMSGGYGGGIVGYCSESTITDCYTGLLLTTTDIDDGALGGIVGYVAYGGTVCSGCNSSCNIISGYMGGGVIGHSGSAIISHCCFNGTISAFDYVGGLIGYSYSNDISDSYATGIVTVFVDSGDIVGYGCIGGLFGVTSEGDLITNCYAKNEIIVNGTPTSLFVGGLIGDNTDSIITSSYYDSEISGMSDTTKGTPKTTVEMKNITTYTDWNFGYHWRMRDGEIYPTLPINVMTKQYAGLTTL